ncbi:arginine-glutamic acid dipeptide repeats protein-like [Sagmatias obliquidens]|uniref:arginine-glutamic acid dipeptide repeats protein-like n=1 Tax=Sagmatias obliquidens TaxID=3371155 RepID=UPI000F442C00|nr:arginine-glutamic acid dipeptide repeats protein-like [Lagenorhynchus obliquidens]
MAEAEEQKRAVAASGSRQAWKRGRTSQGGIGTRGAVIRARRGRGLPEDVALLLQLLPLVAASSAAAFPEPAHGATRAHSSCPGPLAHTVHFTLVLACTVAPLCGPASSRTRTGRLLHPRPSAGLARPLALAVPSSSEGSGAGNRSTADPHPAGDCPSQTSSVANRLRTRRRSAPDRRRAGPPAPRWSEGGRQPPTGTPVGLGPPLDPRSRACTLDFLLHKGQPLTHRESSWDPCPPPCNLSVGSLQSSHRPVCPDPPRNLKPRSPWTPSRAEANH